MPALHAKVTADISNFTRNMGKMKFSASNALGTITTVFGALTTASIGLGAAALKSASDFEKFKFRTQLVYNDLEKGAQVFDKIRKFAANSAFETDEMLESFLQLKQVMSDDEAFANMENLAFAAVKTNKNVTEMSKEIQRLIVRMQSGATGGELRESFGQLLGAISKEDVLNLTKMAKSGRDNAIILKEMLKSLGKLKPELKEAFSKTLEGRLKRMKGIWQDFLASGSEGTALENVGNLINNVADSLKQMQESGELKKFMDDLTIGLESFTKEDMTSGLKAFSLVMQGVANVFVVAANAINKYREAYEWLGTISVPKNDRFENAEPGPGGVNTPADWARWKKMRAAQRRADATINDVPGFGFLDEELKKQMLKFYKNVN